MNRRMLVQTAIACWPARRLDRRCVVAQRGPRAAPRRSAGRTELDVSVRRSGRHALFDAEPDQHANVRDPEARVDVQDRSGRFASAPMVVDSVMYFSAPNGVYARRRGDRHADLEVHARPPAAAAPRRRRAAAARRCRRRPPERGGGRARPRRCGGRGPRTRRTRTWTRRRPTRPARRCAGPPTGRAPRRSGRGSIRRRRRASRRSTRRPASSSRPSARTACCPASADLAAGDLQEHPDHAGRSRAGQGRDRQGVRRRHRQAAVDLLPEGAARRSEPRDVAQRQRRHRTRRPDIWGMFTVDEQRGTRLRPGREGRATTTGAAATTATTSTAIRSSRSTRRPAR